MALIAKNRATHKISELIDSIGAFKGAVEEFESVFAKYMGAPYGIAFPYCRTAVEAALYLTEKKEVILPSYTCLVIPHAVYLAGKVPRFVDVSLDNMNTSADEILESLTPATGAILPTHLYGGQMDMSFIDKNIQRPILVIEDCALGLHPAYVSHNPLVRSVTVYSFNFNKHLSTLYGGMLVTHDKETADKIRQKRNSLLSPPKIKEFIQQIMKFALFSYANNPLIYPIAIQFQKNSFFGKEINTVDVDSPNRPKSAYFKMSPFQATLGKNQLNQADYFVKTRQTWAKKYHEALKGLNGVYPMAADSKCHYSHFTLRIEDRDKRRFREKMLEKGVEAGRVLDYTCHENPFYSKFAHKEFPNSSQLAREVINLPTYPNLTENNFERVVEAVRFAARLV